MRPRPVIISMDPLRVLVNDLIEFRDNKQLMGMNITINEEEENLMIADIEMHLSTNESVRYNVALTEEELSALIALSGLRKRFDKVVMDKKTGRLNRLIALITRDADNIPII